ncbi:sporulation protein [Solwaraspora sp. WMMD406]|uniref:sporulation protein n=1 Tax=Solwaraspora sp. WMMD406 TaxID=3016095 RepID=UPI002416D6CF|nr:sporulation protein [Solwaraspora sp. WMMD406]MDG4766351.1 sporulation protein [Solwaraspora sp. WMMD406]
MVFKKMLGALGIGAPSVDTVLPNPNTRPGLVLAGQVNLTGGSHDARLDQVTVSLVTRVEVEAGGEEHDALAEFHRVGVGSAIALGQGQHLSLPFQILIPWETPVTDLYGHRLHGMTMGLRTEVAIPGAIDRGDLDAVHVHPLPVQERILEAFARLGFTFKGADLEYGRLHGVPQTLPFYQEIEYYAAPQYASGIREVELTFVASEHGVDIVLEFDKRGGLFTPGHDSYGRYRVSHADTDRVDWTAQVDGWVREALSQRQGLLGGHGHPGYGHPGYGHPGHGGHHRGGGMGGVVAGAVGGAALGFAGGMVAGEVFDSFGGDDDGGGEEFSEE